MIKKLQLLIFAGMTFAISTFAQPVLTKAGLGFAIGDVYTIGYNSAILDPGAAGANATWDFSKISSTSTATIKGVAPSTLSNGPSFPNSNVALTSSQGSEYYAVTTSLWERQGVEAGTVLIKYSNAETFLTFPLSYNTSSIDSFVGNYKNQGYDIVRKGAISLKTDGYGTLILPNKTYTNVIRVLYVEEASDYLMGNVFFTNKTTGYQYYAEGTHYPLLSITTSIPSNGGQRNSYSYVSTTPTGLSNYTLESSTFEVYPNPAKEVLHLNFLVQENSSYTLSISNTLGLVVKEFETEKVQPGQVTKKVSLDDLSKGIYFVTIRFKNELYIKKVIIE